MTPDSLSYPRYLVRPWLLCLATAGFITACEGPSEDVNSSEGTLLGSAASTTEHRLSSPSDEWYFSAPRTVMESDLKFITDPGEGTPWFVAQQFDLADATGNTTNPATGSAWVGYIG